MAPGRLFEWVFPPPGSHALLSVYVHYGAAADELMAPERNKKDELWEKGCWKRWKLFKGGRQTMRGRRVGGQVLEIFPRSPLSHL